MAISNEPNSVINLNRNYSRVRLSYWYKYLKFNLYIYESGLNKREFLFVLNLKELREVVTIILWYTIRIKSTLNGIRNILKIRLKCSYINRI